MPTGAAMRIVCRTCGEKWVSQWGTISSFIDEHWHLHHLPLYPKLRQNERHDDYRRRQDAAYRECFEDSRQVVPDGH
ncbi:hypothetical protein LCGC14_0637480 [marine sediment metagenome]|uniref:Uncharacterized protein n=1 Tax=marine sediment metagenome TaxID=412755 RepID=A0A0F9RJE0_9ZZZZ